MKKRFLTMLIAVVMMITMVPVTALTASAATTPAVPTVTGVSFNQSSAAYDSGTNTFNVSDTNPFILTITGEHLSELTGNKLRALFFGDAQGSGGVIIDVTVESDTRAYVSVNTSRLTYILSNAVGSGSSSTKATSVMVQNGDATVGTVNVNLVHAPVTVPVDAAIEVTKDFADWDKAQGFTFILEAVTAGAPMPASNTAVATELAPLASFGNITFESEGTYKYTIIEVYDGIPGVIYDTTAHEVVVTVTRGADNSLTAVVTYDGEDSLVITNTYMKPAYIAAVDVADGTEIQGATIQLLDEQGYIVDEWVSTVEAHEIFGLIAGEIYTVHNTVAPIGYTIATDTQFRLDQYGNVISTGSVDQYGVILVEFAMTEVSIAVVDIADSAKLEGATVQIFDLNGDLVEEWVSTTEAYEVIGLETNKVHTVRTTVTPNGYDIPTDVQFALDENGNITCTGSVSADGMILVELAKTLTNVASVTVGGNTTNYADLEQAFDAAAGASGSTLTLLDNISRDNAIAVTSGNFTVDLNGKTWECTNGRVIDLQNDAKLMIVDGSTNKNGKLLASDNGTPAISMRKNAELEIAGGTVESMTGYAVDMSFSGNATSAELVVSGGKLITNSNTVIGAYGSSITITGGTFEHNDSNSAAHIYFRTGAVDLSGHPDPSGIDICIVHINGDVTLGEDTLNLPDGYVMLDYYGQAQTTLANGYLYEVGKATTYTVTVNTAENGTVTANKTEAAEGETVTLTITPDEGYAIDTLIVTDADSNPVTVDENNSFTVPASKVTVAVTFKELVYVTRDELNDTVNELKALVDSNTATIGELKQALANINLALGALDDTYVTHDELADELADALVTVNAAINKLNNDVIPAIQDDVSQNADDIADLNNTVGNLINTIDSIKDALSALLQEDGRLAGLISGLDTSLSALSDSLDALEDRVTQNEQDITTLNTDLQKAIQDLNNAIASGDSALSSRISTVNASLRTAKKALEKADADNKAELIAKIEAAETALDAAIKAVQNNLNNAKAELNKAITDGNTQLDGKIAALNNALAAAKAALEAADAANKSELTVKIDEADATLQAAINALSNELNNVKNDLGNTKIELESKDSELKTFIIIVCVISCVTLCGSGTLAVFYIIDKKKTANK